MDKRVVGKSGQITMEFLTMVVMTFMIFVIFSIVVREQLLGIDTQEDEATLRDVVGMVQAEINTASAVSNNYERDFVVPELIKNKDYNLSIIGNYLTGKIDDYEVILRIPPVTGDPIRGNNTIRKIAGAIYLN